MLIMTVLLAVLQIKRENLSQFCSCAGEFQLLQTSTHLLQVLNTFQRVGRRFHMPLLTETVRTLIDMNAT